MNLPHDADNPGSLEYHPLALPSSSPARGVPLAPKVHVTDHAARSAAPAAIPDALSLLKALKRRWTLALGLGLVAAPVAAGIAWLVVPPAKYTTSALLSVATVKPKIIFDTRENQIEFGTYQKTQMTLIKSRNILDAVLVDPEVAALDTIREVPRHRQDTAEWLEQELKVEAPNRSEIIQVSMSGVRAKDLQIIVNKVVDTYKTMIIDNVNVERFQRVEMLKDLWDKYQSDLRERRKKIRNLAVEAGSDDQKTLAYKNQLTMGHLAAAERERMKIKSDLVQLQLEAAILEREHAASKPMPQTNFAAMAQEYVEQDPTVVDLKGRLDDLLTKSQRVSRVARNTNDAALREIRASIETTRKDLDLRRARLGPIIAQKLRATPSREDHELAKIKTKMEVMNRFDAELAKEVEHLRTQIGELNVSTLDLQGEQDEIALRSETAKKVKTEVESMDVELMAPDRIKILSKARVPQTKDELKQVKASGAAAAGAFAFALMGITFLEFRTRRVNSADEVVKSLGLRLVGAIPSLPNRGWRLPSRLGGKPVPDYNSVLVDSVDATRTMLLHSSQIESLRIVMVASAVAGEGKTSLACHLAGSLARAGRRTLLIDCDLRRPAVHRLFDLPTGHGISELLCGECAPDEVVLSTQSENLFVVTAGEWNAQAVQGLARGDLQGIFDQFREQFDFIIVDTAPVLPVVDSLLVAQHVDAAVFSILQDVSRIPKIQDAYDRLASLGVKILGAVVAGTYRDGYSSSYYQNSSRTAF